MEWLALLVPIALVIGAFLLFRAKVAWWEPILPIATTALFILIFKFSSESIVTRDIEFHGSIIVSAKYEEAWSTWVDRTCTRTYECGDSKNPRTCTETYDCSYCDDHSAFWEAYDSYGISYRISEQYYNYLMKKWNATPQFVDMKRDIDKNWRCGQDGDAYMIYWDNKIESSEAAVRGVTYTNKVQASHSAFKLEHIEEVEASSLGLYKYPEIVPPYKQRACLGCDSLFSQDINRIETYYQYFNGSRGPRNKVKLFVLLFVNKPLSIVKKQEAYWDGGNQNELVVCIGIDKKGKIDWVKPFSWTDNKRILVDIREDVTETETFNPYTTLRAIESAVDHELHVYKDFKKDFSYLTVELSNNSLIAIWIFSLVISGGCMWWCLKNEFDQD